jgi:hypothetical protein
MELCSPWENVHGSLLASALCSSSEKLVRVFLEFCARGKGK